MGCLKLTYLPTDRYGQSTLAIVKPAKEFLFHFHSVIEIAALSSEEISDTGVLHRYRFQGQEKDDEIKGKGNSVNYTFRMPDTRLGRFFAVDPLSLKYPHNSPYAFSENVVIHAVELEGLEMVLIHGTYTKREDRNVGTLIKAEYKGGSTWEKDFSQKLATATGWTSDQTFEWTWSGKNKAANRKVTAKLLAESLLNPETNPDAANKHATIIGHSHGGNVAKEAQKILEDNGWTVDIINMATPQRKDHQSDASGDGVYLNFYSDNDFIQWFGTDDNYIIRDDSNVGSLGERKDPNAQTNEEVDIETNWFNNSAGHSYHQDSKAQKQILKTVEKFFKKK